MNANQRKQQRVILLAIR